MNNKEILKKYKENNDKFLAILNLTSSCNLKVVKEDNEIYTSYKYTVRKDGQYPDIDIIGVKYNSRFKKSIYKEFNIRIHEKNHARLYSENDDLKRIYKQIMFKIKEVRGVEEEEHEALEAMFNSY